MVTKEKDEELALFLEMRRREKDKTNLFLLYNDNNNNSSSNSNGVDASSGTNNRLGSPISKIVASVPARKTAAEKFLDSENDKSDYDWLLTPPGTPLFPSLEMESQKTIMSQIGMSNARPTALKSRLTNIQEEPASRTNVASKRTTMQSGVNSSNAANRRPSSSGGPTTAARPATPTGRSTLTTSGKPARPSTPTSRATLPSSKPAGPTVRSSTPTKTSARSSTPVSRPSLPPSKSKSRSATPTRQMSAPSGAANVAAPPGGRSSSVTKSVPATLKNPVPSRGCSPTVKSRPWKPNEMPGYSLDAPPNLRTLLPERPASASRGRPGGAIAQSSSIEAGSKGRPRQQSCSPARGRASNGRRISIPTKSRTQTSSGDDVSPVLMGTKMVERVVNMRKLVPPKQDDHSTHNNSTGKSSSLDGTGFGRTLSKKSLDMALRHMDIRRSISGNLRPLTSIPASSVYSVRSGGSAKSKTYSGLDSPHATSSNASSEPSVNNSSFSIDAIEMEDKEFGSEI
ncbi:hypothetical protein JCGZ_25028 [Jatropha curcas]|uniref:Uncharacterized protein n=1 Tax=Jatropha curcas TaxID=180498 RepID=A0A067JY36_JATCU|nr:mucin-17 [Jatropha curcas]KDP24464.1 hypothetical protein JCGZ_25028 [Jatropha curcas]